MKRYKLEGNNGYITEINGHYTHHLPGGAKQACTKKEIEFYGGKEELPKVVYEPIEVEPVIEDVIVEEAVAEPVEMEAELPVEEIIELSEEEEEPVVEEIPKPKTPPKKKNFLGL